MKKIISGLMLFLLMFFVGCNKGDNTDVVSKVSKYLGDLKSYSLSSTMKINRADKMVTMNVDVDYLAPSYYKVSFKNSDNEQLIIKNDSGVFVLTPSLNKQFKFDSDWPLNSSHAYLLEAICKDIKADSNSVGSLDSGTINIECGITHKTNHNLTKMKYSCKEDDLAPKKCVFLNEKGDEVITVDFNSFTKDKELGKDYFNEKRYLSNQEEGSTDSETSSLDVTVGYEVEGNSIITSSNEDNKTIMVYQGEKPYTIIIEEAIPYSEVVVFDTYNDFEVLEVGLCLVNENQMKYFIDDYQVTIYSNSLTIDEYLMIADSISLA